MTPLGTFEDVIPGQVAVYKNLDFGGSVKTWTAPANTASQTSLGSSSWHDVVSSLQVGSGVRALFCNNNCPGGEGSSYEVVGPYNLNDLDLADNKMDNMQCWTYDETDLT